jgi:DMSO/TMAO reductase YedYZ heme-binding membrane subunit
MWSIFLLFALLVYLNILPSAFSIISVALMIVILAYKLPNLYKRAWVFYSLAFVINVLGILFLDEVYSPLLHGGYIAYGFMIVVMFVGVLPNKWTISRRVKKNRGVFSILAFLFISGHVYLHLFTPYGGVNLFGLAAYVIMVPLTIISFRVIRKEIPPKDWFAIQKAAYVIYGLLFVHLIMVSSGSSQIVYAVMATLYINNKLIKEFKS